MTALEQFADMAANLMCTQERVMSQPYLLLNCLRSDQRPLAPTSTPAVPQLVLALR